ncbi:hypothetical protein BDR07DRAFT_1415327 [Suillus spraguei]|nr:hypothetical protein BDR07DRAFT_1441600 [Suillus spraguei]KAG2359331.1 hypothetical protein BDR07DRAFT_1415327 [Suillus spraguei]
MFEGKPVCQKCDRFIHMSLPTTTRKMEPVKKPYEEPEAYKKEVLHDGRPLYDYPAHLPVPKRGHAVKREQIPDEHGVIRYKYITRCVDSEKEKERDVPAKFMKRVKNLFVLPSKEK